MTVDLQCISLAAKQVGISKPTIYRAAKAGSIKLFKRPGMTFVRMAELQDWIAGSNPGDPPNGTYLGTSGPSENLRCRFCLEN